MRFKEFLRDNPTRIAAFVSATVALVVSFLFPEVPTEAAVAFVLSALGLGEFAQRKENKLWEEAKATPTFDEVPD
jgi:hypothetical protein